MRFNRSLQRLIVCLLASVAGCSSDRVAQRFHHPETHQPNVIADAAETLVQVPESEELDEASPVQLVGLQAYDDTLPMPGEEHGQGPPLPEVETPLPVLEQMALDRNPRLIRLYQEYQAAVSRSSYADKLPDPKIGANVFGDPIETAAGSQRANLTFS